MKDMTGKRHAKCGGTFEEYNIWEDMKCTKCGAPTERYIYTKAEQAERNIIEIDTLRKQVAELEGKLAQIKGIAA